jgi:hypothetical protein
VSNLAFGVGCFLVAWLIFERFCDQTRVEAAASGPLPRATFGVRLGRPPRPVIHPLSWKDYHFLCGGRMGLIARILGYGGALAGAVSAHQSSSTVGLGGIQAALVSLLSFAFSIDVAAMAARIFRSEIRDQTLSALAMLPLTVRQLAYQKARACLFAALPGAICMVIGNILYLSALRVSIGGVEVWQMMIVQTLASWISVFLLVHVVAWLSLSMNRGALPVGYVVTQAFKTVISILGVAAIGAMSYLWNSRNFAYGGSLFLVLSPLIGCVGSLVATFILHRVILRRLEGLAGEH